MSSLGEFGGGGGGGQRLDCENRDDKKSLNQKKRDKLFLRLSKSVTDTSSVTRPRSNNTVTTVFRTIYIPLNPEAKPDPRGGKKASQG